MFNTQIAVDEFERLQKQFGFEVLFETGTHRSVGTLGASKFCEYVITYEAVEESFQLSCEAIEQAGWRRVGGFTKPFLSRVYVNGHKTITASHVSSPIGLNHDLSQANTILKGRYCHYLDAHWNAADWPLRDELKAIRDHRKGQDVIIIHDCRVPESWEAGNGYGFDSYGGADLSYDYISDILSEINPNYIIQYNHGGPRGILYALPPI